MYLSAQNMELDYHQLNSVILHLEIKKAYIIGWRADQVNRLLSNYYTRGSTHNSRWIN